MWELIRANRRNSVILLVTMGLCLLGLGYVIGLAAAGPDAAFGGIIIASAIWLVLTMVSFASGDQILLSASKAVRVDHDVHPQLFNVVEEMTIAANLHKMPKVYIINDPAPNAFATGRNPKNASVAVTAGLLARLNRDELQGVIAHEISHILHRDILFVTLAGIMLGSIVLLSQVFLRGTYYGSMGTRRYSGKSRGSGEAQIFMVLIAVAAAILAPIMAQLLYFALSRKREYLADAGAARLTRYPEGLASALEKIANDRSPQLASVNKATAPMYIVNPFKKKDVVKLSDWTSTHPPISERIRILRNMTHGASFRDYANSYSSVTHAKAIVPPSALTDEKLAIRSGSPETGREKAQKQMHQLGDLMRTVNGFVFLTCMCGLKFKIPPNYQGRTIVCPRCKRKSDLPKR